MKLYTEDQVIKAIEMAQECDHDCGGVYFDYGTSDAILEELTPIKLPSDEEIEQEMNNEYPLTGHVGIDHRNHLRKKGFIHGMEWLRDKIQGNHIGDVNKMVGGE